MVNLEQYTYNGVITFYPYKLLTVGQRKYIISKNCSAIYEIDDIMMNYLKYDNKPVEELLKDMSGNYTQEEIYEGLNELSKNYLIKTNGNTNIIESKYNIEQFGDIKINSIILMLCQECNLRCNYCYGKNGEYNNKGRMSVDTGERAINFLFENSGDYETVNITYFGGEPLLHKNLLKHLTIYAKNMAEKNGKKAEFSITTNATLIDESMADFFKENYFSITISIDGDKETTNANRYFANKKGAYDNIINGFRYLNRRVRVSARGTISKNGLDILKNWNHLYELSFNNVHLSHSVNMLDDDDYDVLEENYKKMIDYFFDALEKKEMQKVKRMGNVFTLVERIHNGGMRIKNCGTLNNMLAVDIDGNLYPCHRFVSEKEMQVGNIYTGIDKRKYMDQIKSMLIINNSSCFNCWAMNLCGGGCPQENYIMNGKINMPYYNVCKLMKSIYEYTISKYLMLNDNQRKIFETNDNK